MGKLWEKNRGYSILRRYVDWCTRSSYSSLEVKGKENVPQNAGIILAPNHCNTLMDALVVLQADKGISAYGARADIFRKKKVGEMLRWIRIAPLARERDGKDALEGNAKVFDEAIDCIDHNVPFCMFSEGTHRTKHSLLPIKKGIFRIAAKAARSLDKPVYIVPMGLDYDDYFKFMRRARVSYGVPINVTEYIQQNPEATDTDVFRALGPILHERIASLITYFPDDENYDANWEKYQKEHTKIYTTGQQIIRIILAILSLPFFFVYAVLCSPMWITAAILGRKLKDKAWLNTMRYGIKFVMLPILTLLVGIVAFILLPWYWAMAVLVILISSNSGFYKLNDFYLDIYNSLNGK